MLNATSTPSSIAFPLNCLKLCFLWIRWNTHGIFVFTVSYEFSRDCIHFYLFFFLVTYWGIFDETTCNNLHQQQTLFSKNKKSGNSKKVCVCVCVGGFYFKGDPNKTFSVTTFVRLNMAMYCLHVYNSLTVIIVFRLLYCKFNDSDALFKNSTNNILTITLSLH